MYAVQTDHQIIGFSGNGPDSEVNGMNLIDGNGVTVITATRPDINGSWTIRGEGQPDVTVSSRPEAIQAMVDMALAVLGDNPENGENLTGYSTLVPHGLAEMP